MKSHFNEAEILTKKLQTYFTWERLVTTSHISSLMARDAKQHMISKVV